MIVSGLATGQVSAFASVFHHRDTEDKEAHREISAAPGCSTTVKEGSDCGAFDSRLKLRRAPF